MDDSKFETCRTEENKTDETSIAWNSYNYNQTSARLVADYTLTFYSDYAFSISSTFFSSNLSLKVLDLDLFFIKNVINPHGNNISASNYNAPKYISFEWNDK